MIKLLHILIALVKPIILSQNMIGFSEKKVDKIFENWQNFLNNELFWHLAQIMKF